MAIRVPRAIDAGQPNEEQRKRKDFRRRNLQNQMNMVAQSYVQDAAIKSARSEQEAMIDKYMERYNTGVANRSGILGAGAGATVSSPGGGLGPSAGGSGPLSGMTPSEIAAAQLDLDRRMALPLEETTGVPGGETVARPAPNTYRAVEQPMTRFALDSSQDQQFLGDASDSLKSLRGRPPVSEQGALGAALLAEARKSPRVANSATALGNVLTGTPSGESGAETLPRFLTTIGDDLPPGVEPDAEVIPPRRDMLAGDERLGIVARQFKDADIEQELLKKYLADPRAARSDSEAPIRAEMGLRNLADRGTPDSEKEFASSTLSMIKMMDDAGILFEYEPRSPEEAALFRYYIKTRPQ